MDDATSRVSDALPSLYPDSILESYQLNEPQGYVTVRGRVVSLNQYSDTRVYGVLRGHKHEICFCCPPDKSPTEKHQNVILGGFLKVKPSPVHRGLDIELRGEMLSTWEGSTYSAPEIISPERVNKSKTLLTQFVQSHQDFKNQILILGSRTGIDDIQQASGMPINEEVVNVSDVDKFFRGAKKAIEKLSPEAIVITRGGTDSSVGMDIWNNARVIDWLLKTECILYTAIGHGAGYVFLDQYADQSFISPTDFGHSLKACVEQRDKDARTSEKYKRIEHDNSELSEKIETVKSESMTEIRRLKHSFEQRLEEEEQVLQKQQARTRFYIASTVVLSLAIIGFISIVVFKEQLVALLSG